MGFGDVIERAGLCDPKAMRDAQRLYRAWKKAGRAPQRWTVRWNNAALSVLRDTVGMEALKPLPGGGRYLDLRFFIQKTGQENKLLAELENFFNQTPPKGQQPLNFLKALYEKTSSPMTREWLTICFDKQKIPSEQDIHVLSNAIALLEQKSDHPVFASDLGVWAGAHSKYFRSGSLGRRLLAHALLEIRHARALASTSEDERAGVLEDAGLTDCPSAYCALVCGPLQIGSPPLSFPWTLAQKNQAVVLTWQNLEYVQLLPDARSILTVENETPFHNLIQEGRHLNTLLVCTAGFPNRAVMALLQKTLPARIWQHWGDTDLSGVRIARSMAEKLNRHPIFYRCGPEDIQRCRENLQLLTRHQRQDIAADLRISPDALGASVLRAGLAHGGWLEQESWEPVKL